MSMIVRVTAALVGVGLALSLTACTSSPTKDAAAASAAYCTSSKAVLSELSTLKDMVTSGDSTRNEISDQVTAVVDAATSAYRASDDLAESVRGDIQAADKAFREAIRAIPPRSTVAEATQAYMDAMDAYNTSIDAVRTSLGC